MDSDRPYLSVVIASPNDVLRGGHASPRSGRASIRSSSSSNDLGCPSELILVDWNPPTRPGADCGVRCDGRSLLRRCTVRLITVPPKLHARLPLGDRLPESSSTALVMSGSAGAR